MDSVRRWLEAGRRDLAGHCALHGAWAVADAGGDCAELEAAVSWLYRRMRDDELNAMASAAAARIARELKREEMEAAAAAPVWERRGSHLSRPHGRV